MQNFAASRSRFLALGAVALALAATGIVAIPTAASAATGAATPIALTEWEYNGSEFAEFTNVSAAPVDLTTWSFSDSAAHAGDVSFAPLGTVLPGESFLITEASATDFRTLWGLPDSVKVLGDNGQNLGRSDEINIYDGATLVDSLTYNDGAASGNAKGPRTDTASAWPSAAALGANNASLWTKSTVGDAEHSWTSAPDPTSDPAGATYIGSPGISTFGKAVDFVRINEATKDGHDTVELVNLAPVAVDVTGWRETDGDTVSHPASASDSVLGVTSIPAHDYVTFDSPYSLGSDDGVTIYLPDATTVVDTTQWAGSASSPSWARCPDATGAFVTSTAATFGGANTSGCPIAPPASGDPTKVRINEVDSATDTIELVNTGTADVDLTGWQQTDSDPTHSPSAISPTPTTIPTGGYATFHSTEGLGKPGDTVSL